MTTFVFELLSSLLVKSIREKDGNRLERGVFKLAANFRCFAELVPVPLLRPWWSGAESGTGTMHGAVFQFMAISVRSQSHRLRKHAKA